jgi:hypothetical protein
MSLRLSTFILQYAYNNAEVYVGVRVCVCNKLHILSHAYFCIVSDKIKMILECRHLVLLQLQNYVLLNEPGTHFSRSTVIM